MSMLYVLIPLAVLLLAFAVWALVWAIRTGQFDDLVAFVGLGLHAFADVGDAYYDDASRYGIVGTPASTSCWRFG